MLKDRYGRIHNQLRVSVTDRCNLRCIYCMNPEGLPLLPREQILSYEEILAVVRVAAELGINRLRFTGGEPLVRKGLDWLIGEIRCIPGIDDLSLTTNGLLLAEQAPSLRRAGLDRVNISLDSLDPATYASITRGGDLARVLAGLEAALDAGLHPVKVNAVLMRGINDREVPDFLRLANRLPIQVRFIEYMPIGAPGETQNEYYLSADYILEAAASLEMDLVPVGSPAGAGPAVAYGVRGGEGQIGLIRPISHGFCAGCNRLRLTADGFLKPCLYWQDELPVRPVLDKPDVLRRLFQRAVRIKHKEHALGRPDLALARMRCMSRIGG